MTGGLGGGHIYIPAGRQTYHLIFDEHLFIWFSLSLKTCRCVSEIGVYSRLSCLIAYDECLAGTTGILSETVAFAIRRQHQDPLVLTGTALNWYLEQTPHWAELQLYTDIPPGTLSQHNVPVPYCGLVLYNPMCLHSNDAPQHVNNCRGLLLWGEKMSGR